MKRILLVSPPRGSDFPKDHTRFNADKLNLPRGVMPPLDLATISALTPPQFEVDLWDESVNEDITDETDLGKNYDLIGVTGYMTHIPWALNLAGIAKRRGIPVVIGGPGVSGAPEKCRGTFDVIFIGEAELTWPQFLADFEKGSFRSEYRQVQRPDIDRSPAPRWTGFEDMARSYMMGAVQTTRGCPFDCEFCDVIHLFGRQPRHKSIDTVLAEVAALQRLGMRSIFFCDDNFIGRPKYAKDLLRALIPLNNSFDRPLGFGTQLTINLADDAEMLELIADANFHWVLIGIESPREASLREANKPQNYKANLVEAIRRIQSYGVPVKGNMIVGFDHDDTAIFDETYDYLREARVVNASISLLKAYPGTPLLARLQRDGRIIEVGDDVYSDTTKAMTNIVPKQMSRVELFEGYKRLLERLRSWDYFKACVKEMVTNITRPPNVPRKTAPDPARVGVVKEAMNLLDDEGRAAVMDVVGTVLKHAPYMMEKVVYLLFRHGGHLALLPRVTEALDRRIALESSPGHEPPVVRALPSIPDGFRAAAQRDAFPTTYQWLMEGLADPLLVPEGLIRVWKSFLIRWSETFEGFEDFHFEHLRELCERTVEEAQSGQFDGVRVNAEVAGLSRVQLRRLAGEVFVSVEQDLRGTAPPRRDAAVSTAATG